MKKQILGSFTALLTIPLVLASCGQPAPTTAATVKSDKPRITSPVVSAGDQKQLVDGNSAFAFDLYQALREKDGNLFYSPHSISVALAMTYAGARTETEQQMADTLHYTLPQDRLHPAFNSLALELAKRGEGARGKDGEGFRLNIANAIWGQDNYTFLPTFLDLLAQNYGAGLRIVDFIKEAEKSRVTINDWVSDETEERIKDLIPQGAIDELTRLVLTNAVYFNAAWLRPFNEGATSDGTFHLANGSQATVPMMHQTESFGYGSGQDYQAVELPYDGNEMSMLVVLPAAGKFESFEEQLDAEQIDAIIDALRGARVDLTMPKFEFESSFGLKDTLAEMGMPVAFTENADFSGMTGKRDLMITDVLHKAFVAVDEEGTEAAAATAVIVGVTSAPIDPPVVMTIDRPFVFLIRDIQTGAVVFVGRVENPGK